MQLCSTLRRFATASSRHLDCWSISITAPDASYFPELPYALAAEADNVSMHAMWEARRVVVRPVPAARSLHVRTQPARRTSCSLEPLWHALQPCQVGGRFWNYLSVGMDAEAAYGFHTLRESHSWAASSRLLNQVRAGGAVPCSRWLPRRSLLVGAADGCLIQCAVWTGGGGGGAQAWYSWYSCSSGWFCGAQVGWPGAAAGCVQLLDRTATLPLDALPSLAEPMLFPSCMCARRCCAGAATGQ